MLYYQELKWDRHRWIYLKFGFLSSLLIVFILLNTHFNKDLLKTYSITWEDPHANLSPQIQLEIKTQAQDKPKGVHPPKKSSFLIKLDSTFIEPDNKDPDSLQAQNKSTHHSIQSNRDTTAISPPKLEPPKTNDNTFLLMAERMPVFGECTDLKSETERNQCSNESILKFLGEQIQYPKRALLNNIEGMVIARIIIDKNGMVSDPRIIRGIGEDCDAEVIRILRKMPVWSPGSQNGRKVSVQMTIPVHFKIRS